MSNMKTLSYYTLSDLQLSLSGLYISYNLSQLGLLNRPTVTEINNAFDAGLRFHLSGVSYVSVQKLATLLRTGNGAHNVFCQDGIIGLVSPSKVYHIDDSLYISGSDFCALVEAQLRVTYGLQHTYLKYISHTYHDLMSSGIVRDLKDVYVDKINRYRPLLKKRRIDKYKITECEFTGQPIPNIRSVAFAHIDSVAHAPLQATDLKNGVIIFNHIHDDLTRLEIHNFTGMYRYCVRNKYSIEWAKDCVSI